MSVPSNSVPTRHLVLIGFGNVGRRFVRLLDEVADRLARDEHVRFVVVGIATRQGGAVFDPSGLDTTRTCMLAENGQPLTPAALSSPSAVRCNDVFELMSRAGTTFPGGRAAMLETTTLDVTRGEPATSHMLAALDAGLHAITANKGPVACRYDEVVARARGAGRTFRFEGAVMDGIPIFNLAREALRGVDIVGIRGIVNSTTNFILTAMEAGSTYEVALAEMQRQGIAEADPTLDVEGWDAAAKIAALSNVLMHASLRPQDVDRTGITQLTPADLATAARAGARLRLVATARRTAGRVSASVRPVEVPADDLLAQLPGMANALIFETDLLGELAIVQRSGGLTQTAYALLSDLLSLRAPQES